MLRRTRRRSVACATVGGVMSSTAGQTLAPMLEQASASAMLRLVITGSVDDGKSTLIGRLLYDSKQILNDQLEALRAASERRNGERGLDLSLLTDGLRAEREQGITIDVAYRYFQTPHRKFIIADTPGHESYTRNMVTGASTADVAVLLIDARKGVVEQTRRHAFIASLLGIRHLVVCVNKMDLAGLRAASVRAGRAGVPRVLRPAGGDRRDLHPDFGRPRREHRRALAPHALVPGAGAALPPRARPHLLGPEPDRLPVPGAVGGPAGPGPRARARVIRTIAGTRARSRPACSAPAIPWSCSPVARRPASPRSRPRTDRWGRRARRCRSRSASTATSTSRAGT